MSSGRERRAKEYATDEIVVEWEPRLCFHSRNCVRSFLYEGDKAALCRCGGSQNKPFCDGTHRKTGFGG